jgi:hypothetical protein
MTQSHYLLFKFFARQVTHSDKLGFKSEGSCAALIAGVSVAGAEDNSAPSRIDSIAKSARDMMPAMPSLSLPSMPDLSLSDFCDPTATELHCVSVQ